MNYLTSPRVKRVAAKTLYIFTALVTILNVSSVGFLAMPQTVKAATPTPVENPGLGNACGLDIALVLDNSQSITTAQRTQMKSALTAFTTALNGTPTEFSVVHFGTTASVIQGFTANITDVNNAINSLPANPTGQYTNWEAGFNAAESTFPNRINPDLVIFATDGDPTASTAGSNGPVNETGYQLHLPPAITAANAIKTANARILALGIGDPTVSRLQAISGPNVDTGNVLTSDVITTDFTNLADDLAEFAIQTCGGTITVHKLIDADGNLQTTGDRTNGAGWDFTIAGQPETTSADGKTNAVEVDAGTYDVTETVQPNYNVLSAECSSGGVWDSSTISGVPVSDEEIVTCTFINTLNTHKLRIKKNVDTNGDGHIDIERATDWTWDIQGGEQNIATDDWRILPAGSYTVSEDQKSGYHAVDFSCDNGQQFGASESGTITLDRDVICYFTNSVSTGKISGYKFNDLNKNGVWDQPDEPAMPGVTINLTGDVANTDVTDGNGYYEFLNLLPGDYTVSEVVPTDWAITTPNDVDVTLVAGQDQRVDFGNRATECKFVIEKDGPATVDVNGNITYTITYHNEGDGWCIGGGVKVTDYIPEYTTYVSHDSSPTHTSNYDGEKVVWNLGNVAPDANGILTLVVKAEDKPDQCGEWEIDNTASFWARDKVTGAVQTGSDDHTTLVEKECVGTLTVKKIVVGGDAVSSDWTMYVDGPTTLDFPGSAVGTENPVTAGDYVITESDTPLNYTLSYSGDCDSQGNVTVNHGDDKTCVLTNTRDTAKITVNKFLALPGQNPIYNPADWYWHLDAGAWLSGGTMKVINTNQSYSVSEDTAVYSSDDYTTTWSCLDITDNNAVVSQGAGTSFDVTATYSGQHIVCTFTNVRDTTRITFDKVIVGGGPAVDADFEFTVDGQGTYHDGNAVTLPTNAMYAVAESSQYDDLYTLTDAWGACAIDNGAIKLYTDGRDDTCYVENTRDTGTISGHKFEDVNGNGVWDDGENPLEGWEICADAVGYHSCTTTDHTGYYEFNPLATGQYTLTETAQTHWIQTKNVVNPVTVLSGTDNQDNDFGNFKKGRFAGKKWHDVNGNGILGETGENPLEGWTIKATSGDREKITTTAANGTYVFAFMPDDVGIWTISEVQQPGWTQTYPVPETYTFEMYSGHWVSGNDFGNYKIPELTVIKHVINDNGGTLEADAFTMNVTGTNVSPQNSFPGDENGTTVSLSPGAYSVDEDFVIGYAKTLGDDCSGIVKSGDKKVCTITNDDIPGRVVGHKYEDVNRNGTQDQGEADLEGWTFYLRTGDATGPIAYTAVSNEFGYFEFTDVFAGTYYLTEALPSDWDQITPLSGYYEIVVTPGYDNGQQESYFEFGNAEKVTLDLDKYNDQEVAQGGDGLAAPSEVVNYTIDWLVAGNSIATNVLLVDHIPAELTIDVASITSTMATINGTPTWDATARTITWDFGTQAPNASGQVTYTGTVNLPLDNGTPIINVARLSADNADPTFVEDDSIVTVTSAPILNIDKVVDLNNELGFVNPGDTVTYTIQVWNTGTEIAYHTQLSDLLPDGFTYAGTTVSVQNWALGDLIPGDAPVIVTFDVTIGDDVVAGFYDNLAVTWADNHGNVDDDATVEVRVPSVLAAEPELTIEKTVKETFINPGDTVTYTVVVTNIGEATAFNVMLQDVLPAGFTFESGAITQSWNLGDINPEESRTVTYTVNTNKALLAGEYENVAITWADNHDKLSDFASVEVRLPAVLAAEDLPVTGGNLLLWLYAIGALAIFSFAGWMLRLTADSKQK